jgi:hypothetical protein
MNLNNITISVNPLLVGGEFFYALIKKYKAGWSVLGPPRLKRLHYKDTDNN